MKLLKSVLTVSLLAVVGGVTINAINKETGYEQQAANHWGSRDITKSYILQGANSDRLNKVVANVGGNVSREFPIINAVSAMLTSQQAEEIRELGGVRIQDDRTVMTMNNGNGNGNGNGNAKKYKIDNYIAKQVGADLLHQEGITGTGVTVAVVDSGANMGGSIGSFLFRDTNFRQRVAVKYDAFRGSKTYFYNDDQNGHGTHVTGIIASSLKDDNGRYNGIAPDVYVLSVRAFDANGASSYSKVLDSLNWIFENRYRYKIRVVNMSLGAEARSHYWNDPINQAVMRLWQAGIVVVSSAGNNGQDQGITVPGNNPYAITVGAVTDNKTPYDYSDDRITTFSSRGPTTEGFIKPEVVSYGGEVATKMDKRYFKKAMKASVFGEDYAVISGTSQAAALVTGIAALVISNDPYITPDTVKCRIMATAQAANDGKKMTYSPFAQGAGLVNAHAAVHSTATNCANQGLNVEQDLLGTQHFGGPARMNDSGEFYIQTGDNQVMLEGNHWSTEVMNLQGNHWSTEVMNLQGNHWSTEVMNLQGNHWSTEVMNLQGNHWSTEVLNLQGNHWSTEVMNIQSEDLDLAPIDPSVVVPVEEDGWK